MESVVQSWFGLQDYWRSIAIASKAERQRESERKRERRRKREIERETGREREREKQGGREREKQQYQSDIK